MEQMSRVLPILFNTEMVQAILDGRKNTTRRIVKSPYFVDDNGAVPLVMRTAPKGGKLERQIGKMPYPDAPYKINDILYVRETSFKYAGEYIYRASAAQPDLFNGMWRPSIHMPKEAARIWLKVTDVGVERLQNMKLSDFLDEGVVIREESFNDPENAYQQAKSAFRDIWNPTIKKSEQGVYGWDANPWVEVTRFERCEKPMEE